MTRDVAHQLRVVQSIVGGLAAKASSAQPKPPPSDTDSNQGWRWSVDRGIQSAGVVPSEWRRQAGRQEKMHGSDWTGLGKPPGLWVQNEVTPPSSVRIEVPVRKERTYSIESSP